MKFSNYNNNRKKGKTALKLEKQSILIITYYYTAVIHTSFYRNTISGIALICILSIVNGNHKALPQSLPEMSEKNETTEREILKKSGKKKLNIQT